MIEKLLNILSSSSGYGLNFEILEEARGFYYGVITENHKVISRSASAHSRDILVNWGIETIENLVREYDEQR